MIVRPRPAATVALVRDGPDGLEVLMMVRPMEAEYAPRALVFPGGRVDDADSDNGWLDVCDLDGADRALVGQDGNDESDPAALASRLAAIREVFEETAVLIGTRVAPAPDWADDARRRVHSGSESLQSVLRAAGFRIRPAELVYFARWITPEAQPKRFDARFYAAAMPAGQQPAAAPGEVESVTWISPQQALAGADNAEAYVLPPTRAVLTTLSQFADVKIALPGLLESRNLSPILPRMRAGGGLGPNIRVVLPGEPGYED